MLWGKRKDESLQHINKNTCTKHKTHRCGPLTEYQNHQYWPESTERSRYKNEVNDIQSSHLISSGDLLSGLRENLK